MAWQSLAPRCRAMYGFAETNIVNNIVDAGYVYGYGVAYIIRGACRLRQSRSRQGRSGSG